jgi:hypothetical protein
MKNNKWWLNLLVILGILSPMVFTLYYLLKFGVDVPFWDQWVYVPLIKAYYNGQDLISLIVQQENEHRLIFPKLFFFRISAIN